MAVVRGVANGSGRSVQLRGEDRSVGGLYDRPSDVGRLSCTNGEARRVGLTRASRSRRVVDVEEVEGSDDSVPVSVVSLGLEATACVAEGRDG